MRYTPVRNGTLNASAAFRPAPPVAVPASVLFVVAMLSAWTVALLAAAAGMSRSAFAVHFAETVGEAPMAYVTRWRMLLACGRLAVKGAPISRVATSLSYASDSAFGAAFKRILGVSPRKVSEAS